MQKFLGSSLLVLIVGLLSSPLAQATPFEDACARIAASKAKDSKRLDELLTAAWRWQETESPEDATFNGFAGVNDRWSDMSHKAIERRKRELEAPLRALRRIKSARLTDSQRLNYNLFRRNIEEQLDGRQFPDELLAVTQLSGPQQYVPEVLTLMPAETPAQVRDILARLKKIPLLLDQTTALLREGLKAGITPPKVVMRDVPDQVKALFEDDPEKSPLLVSLRGSKDRASKTEATRLLLEEIIPAYKRLRDFLKDEYVPGCRETIALGALPNGAAWYSYRARVSTTIRRSPQELHDLGLSEVKRIRKEMDAVIASTGFKGSFEEFKDFLRTDSRFFYDNADDLVRAYRDIAKRIDPNLIKMFGKLPRLPYGVKPVPAYAEKSQTTAYYEPGSPAAGRAGYFFANTYDLKTRPKWEMEALTLHEAVPGHHLQISLAQEMEAVPEFRKYGFYTAFIEGWGLYAEGLGADLGLYEDPYSHFGQLTYEMWRAVRLVVDTGMHALGWSREQAIAFFKENTSKTDHDIVVEVDRYLVMPGQALAYKVGQLKFRELRDRARAALGDRFDIRAYHDAVLANGALPMDTLEEHINAWIAARKHEKR